MGFAVDISMAINSANLPHIAYSDSANTIRAKAKRFNGTDWTEVGGGPFFSGQADYLRIAIDSTDRSLGGLS